MKLFHSIYSFALCQCSPFGISFCFPFGINFVFKILFGNFRTSKTAIIYFF